MFSLLYNLLFLWGPVVLLVQIALCLHVYRTGRPYWWILVIIMGSLLGCIVYVLMEILPDVGRSGRGQSTLPGLSQRAS